uniref:Uncharacterized protein n=1 Tax=Arundo donax TaxID=35708 RepID=A0A0A9E860_ARUDO
MQLLSVVTITASSSYKNRATSSSTIQEPQKKSRCIKQLQN